MMFKPCIIIPIYNHKETIFSTVEKIQKFSLPCIIVDDGSNEETQNELQRVKNSFNNVQFYRLDKNSGKGAALSYGFAQGLKSGFSHALQIDADGQHEVNDIPRLLEVSEQHPKALISGKPVYDESVPKTRLYSRYITHVWVWIETLSLQIEDSMCGFRVYPLASTCAVVNKYRMGKRMNFDTEIMVRLFWQQVNIIQIPTHITYPENGISHFRMFRDNLLISLMHAKLFFGMLIRLPWLLKNKLFPLR